MLVSRRSAEIAGRGGATAADARRALWIGLAVFGACLLGIATRQPGTLAVFWPANALLLGLLMRSPRSATVFTWTFSLVGFVGADALTGSPVTANILVNTCNMAGIATGFVLYRRLHRGPLELTQVQSLGTLAIVVAAASASAGVFGAFGNAVFHELPWMHGWNQWFAGQFLNYMATTPAVLSAPVVHTLWRSRSTVAVTARRALPATALLALCLMLVWFVGGAGALMFTMPALVLAALTTSVFVTSLFILTSTVSLSVLSAGGRLGATELGSMPGTLSVCIGLSLSAIAPIVVAIVTRQRRVALTALRHAVAHDDLTGALRRDEFYRRVEASVVDRAALLMMDLDDFKALNDTLGHRAGDSALRRFARDVQRQLDEAHVFARLGGEEFAVFLPCATEGEAVELAESIRLGQASSATTVSIGVASGPNDIATLYDAADRALYEAKRLGRNRIATEA